MQAGSLSGAELARALLAHGFDFFTGVPCSLANFCWLIVTVGDDRSALY